MPDDFPLMTAQFAYWHTPFAPSSGIPACWVNTGSRAAYTASRLEGGFEAM